MAIDVLHIRDRRIAIDAEATPEQQQQLGKRWTFTRLPIRKSPVWSPWTLHFSIPTVGLRATGGAELDNRSML